MTLPVFPPLFASGRWWRSFLRQVVEGVSESEAIARASRESGARRRDWMRFAVTAETMLSIPVKGSASALKNRNADEWLLAGEAPREWSKALSTLATLYGRTSFHAEISAIMRAMQVCPGAPASGLCLKSFECVKTFLGLAEPSLIESYLSLPESAGKSIAAVKIEMESAFNPDLSILDALFRLGPDAIFPLFPPLK